MTADTVGGVWTYALDLIRALERADVEVTLATMGPEPSRAQRRDLERLTNAHLEPSSYRLEWMADPWDDVAAAGDWLLDVAERTRPDLVHLNAYAHAALPWEVPVVVVGHSCVLSWWASVRGERAPASWNRYRHAVRTGLRSADLVVAPTRFMLSCLVDLYGPLPRTAVVHNGRFTDGSAPSRKENAVLSVGRLWDAAKNITALAKAAPRVRWPIRVAGEDRHPDGGRRALDPLHALGPLPHRALVREMGKAAIYALPARYEPFGLSALEAANARCALVLGDIPSLREVWGDAAVYVSPDDPEALAGALNRLIEDPSRLRRMADAARERSLRYRLVRMAAEYLALYRELVDPRTGPFGNGGGPLAAEAHSLREPGDRER